MISLILASASPRRKKLLARLLNDFPNIDSNFTIIPAHIDESLIAGESAEIYVTRLAREKALAIAQKIAPTLTQTVILAADTSVVIDGHILGKPQNDADALRMLTTLSGHNHTVITGYALVLKSSQLFDIICNFSKTQIDFRTLSKTEIADYIATGEPQDKAGAYAIQGGAASFVKNITGSFDNVVGLPTEDVRRELINLLAKQVLTR